MKSCSCGIETIFLFYGYFFYISKAGGAGGGVSAFMICSSSLLDDSVRSQHEQQLECSRRRMRATRTRKTSFLLASFENNSESPEDENFSLESSSSSSSSSSTGDGNIESFHPKNNAFPDAGTTGSSSAAVPPPPPQQQQQQQPLLKNIWETSSHVGVQGTSLKTWSFVTPSIQRVQVVLKTDGRPMNAQIDLWQGPNSTPQKMAVYIEDGSLRPFTILVETPGYDNSIAIRNVAQLEFPLSACLEAEMMDYHDAQQEEQQNDHPYYKQAGVLDIRRDRHRRPILMSAAPTFLVQMHSAKTIQGGSVHTFPFAFLIESVQILLTTDGRPLNARIELLQGPNNVKQIIEVYAEDGMSRPFYSIIECPGSGNVIRLINTGAVEFPISAIIEPYRTTTRDDNFERGGVGGNNDDFFTVT